MGTEWQDTIDVLWTDTIDVLWSSEVTADTIVPLCTQPAKGIVVVTWSGVGQDSICTAVTTAQFKRKSIQVTGTFGGVEIIAQGSNDGGTTFEGLTNHKNSPVSITSAGIEEIGSHSLAIRPDIIGGDATTSITITLVLSKD